MEQLSKIDGEMKAAAGDQAGVDARLQAQTLVFNHIYNFYNSLSLKCAVMLDIPDIIHSSHHQSMTITELASALPIHPSKATHLERLMRLLVHLGFFKKLSNNDLQEERFVLTQASLLLLKDNPSSLRPLVLLNLDPVSVETVELLSDWFQNNQSSSTVPFSCAHGMNSWDLVAQDARLNSLFNDAMAGDSHLLGSAVTSKCRGIFEGMNSLVDVGGGIGILSKAIAEEFPQLKCVVLDLPHVVAGLKGTQNLNYVAGDMFEAIPPADVVLLKSILHNWSDNECVRILKRCKEAILSKNKEGDGKVIIIDIVIGADEDSDKEATETKLLFDMVMMSFLTGWERNEKQLAKLFFDAGFTSYKIITALGLRSLIEVYP